MPRIIPPNPDSSESREIPLSNLFNFGPVTLAEFESIGLHTLAQLDALGWEGVCRKWIKHYPERLNANAFLGILCTLKGKKWTGATKLDRTQSANLAKKIRIELKIS